jgi:AIR synthase-related protein
MRLAYLVENLRSSIAIQDKIQIRRAYGPALNLTKKEVRLGDDCASIPEDDGSYLLFAAEGMLESFVREDPWFSGYSAVMVNISDICAMGGRPIAIVDVIWAPDYSQTELIWQGITSAANNYGVPIVGGHTTISHDDGPTYLAASIVGRANNLLTSFDASNKDVLIMIVDLNGSYRKDKPFWNASVDTSSKRLKNIIQLLPVIADNKWCKAAKDISNGGIIGSLIMLLECSNVGAKLYLDKIPRPSNVDLGKWLISYPSFGYLLSVSEEYSDDVIELFTSNELACSIIGDINSDNTLELILDSEHEIFWNNIDTI